MEFLQLYEITIEILKDTEKMPEGYDSRIFKAKAVRALGPGGQRKAERTIRTKLNDMKYKPQKAAKTRPAKKIPQTDAIFEQVHSISREADDTEGVSGWKKSFLITNPCSEAEAIVHRSFPHRRRVQLFLTLCHSCESRNPLFHQGRAGFLLSQE